MKETWIFTGYLVLAAGYDWKKQRIPVMLFLFFGVVGVVFGGQFGGRAELSSGELDRWGFCAAALLPGILNLLLTFLTRGAIGAGDGCFFLTAACYLPWRELWTLWMGGLLCSSIGGLLVIVRCRRRGVSAQNVRLPFLPFLLPVWVWMQL